MRGVIALCLASLVVLLISGVGCGNEPDVEEGQVRLSLNWYPDAQHGGFYAALENGYYADEGLDVEIIPGGPSVPVLEQVALGRSEFGVSNADQILLKRSQGADLVALLAPLQNSPRCIMVHRSTGIESFDDLKQLTLALGPGRPFAEYMKRHADLEDVRVVNYSGTVTRFLTDERYAQQGYVFSEPFVAERKGADPHCLMLSDIGFNPYTSCLFADESFIKKHPDVVEKFVRATQRGWIAYLEDPEPINQIIHEANPEMDRESLTYAAAAIRDLCLPAGMTPDRLGEMTPERWERLAEQLKEIEFVDDDFDPSGAYRSER